MSVPSGLAGTNGTRITEVVVQGIRRFAELRRFTFAPGYNVLYGLSAAGKSTLHEAICSLLLARPSSGESESFKSLLPEARGTCRAGLSLEVGGETFRILKDYAAGALTLSRFLPAEKKFELVASDEESIRRWLTQTAGMTVGPYFAQVFSIGRSDLPSSSEGASVIPVRREMVDSGFEERIRSLPLAEKRNLLKQLIEEYHRHAEVKTSEFLQDGLRAKLFEVDAAIRARDEGQQELKALEEELKESLRLPKLPDGLEERIEAYKRAQKTREAEMDNLLPRQEDAHAQIMTVIPPFFTEPEMRRLSSPMDAALALVKRNRIVDAGLAAVLAGTVCLALGGTLAYVGILLLVAGIGVSVVWQGFIVFLKGKERFDALRKQVDMIDDQVRAAERKYELDTSVVRNLMKAYKVEDPREMKEMEKERNEAVAKREEIRARIAKAKPPAGEADLDAAKARLTRQIADIDERMAAISANFSTDAKELEPQIERLDREVARAEGRKATPRAKLFGHDDADDKAVATGTTDDRDSIQKAVEAFCGAFRLDSGKLLRAVQEAYAKNLKAMSGGRYGDAVFDAMASVALKEDGKPPIPFESLDAISKDVAWLALKLTLLQLSARGSSRPIMLLDDPFDFEEGRLAALSRAFRALGPYAQVIHLTSRPVHARLAEQTLEL